MQSLTRLQQTNHNQRTEADASPLKEFIRLNDSKADRRITFTQNDDSTNINIYGEKGKYGANLRQTGKDFNFGICDENNFPR